MLTPGDVPAGRTTRVDSGHLMPRYRILPQSEVIRAILLDYSPCPLETYRRCARGLLGSSCALCAVGSWPCSTRRLTCQRISL